MTEPRRFTVEVVLDDAEPLVIPDVGVGSINWQPRALSIERLGGATMIPLGKIRCVHVSEVIAPPKPDAEAAE